LDTSGGKKEPIASLPTVTNSKQEKKEESVLIDTTGIGLGVINVRYGYDSFGKLIIVTVSDDCDIETLKYRLRACLSVGTRRLRILIERE